MTEAKHKTSYEAFHVECNTGWRQLYEPLLALCELKGVTVLQVKEKFGGLRFYAMGEKLEEVQKLIDAAESYSYRTCEDCGTSKVLDHKPDADGNYRAIYAATTGSSKTSGWIRTLCQPCREAWDAKREARA